MAITKIQSESLNLADDYTFTGTITGAGGNNRPAFYAYSTGEVTVPNVTSTFINNYSIEVYDTDNCFSASRFTPNVAGKYWCSAIVGSYPAWTATQFNVELKKNNTTAYAYTGHYVQAYMNHFVGGYFDMNGTTDYVQVYCYQNSGASRQIDGGTMRYFGGFKIIT
jgi:hypothetical protein